MNQLGRAITVFLVAAGAQGMPACSTACLRHSDCSSDEVCTAGICVLERDGADARTVDAMTAAPAPTTSSPPPVMTTEPARDASGPPLDAGRGSGDAAQSAVDATPGAR